MIFYLAIWSYHIWGATSCNLFQQIIVLPDNMRSLKQENKISRKSSTADFSNSLPVLLTKSAAECIVIHVCALAWTVTCSQFAIASTKRDLEINVSEREKLLCCNTPFKGERLPRTVDIAVVINYLHPAYTTYGPADVYYWVLWYMS